jgi:hypothetical protein
VLDALFLSGYKAVVSKCEVTFHTHIPVTFLLKRACSRLTMKRFESWICFGSPRSSWQVRVYQKAESVVRLEFVIRRTLLRASKINTIASLTKVRDLGLFDWFPIRELRDSCAAGGGSIPPGWRGSSMRKLMRFCTNRGLTFQNLTKQCPEERALRRMLARFIW